MITITTASSTRVNPLRVLSLDAYTDIVSPPLSARASEMPTEKSRRAARGLAGLPSTPDRRGRSRSGEADHSGPVGGLPTSPGPQHRGACVEGSSSSRLGPDERIRVLGD